MISLLSASQLSKDVSATINIPQPNIVMSGGVLDGIEYNFSEDFAFPEEQTVSVYSMEVASEEEQLKQISDLDQISFDKERVVSSQDYIESSDNYNYYLLDDLQKTVMINKSTGYWAVLNNDLQDDTLTVPSNLPSDEEAVQIAKKYIEDYDLYEGELGEPLVIYSTTGGDANNKEQVLAKRICFTPPIDGINVYGLFRIIILIEDNGVVTDIFKQVNPVKFEGKVKLKTKEEVIKDVLANPEQLSSSADGISLGLIDDCQLAYYVDGEAVNDMTYIYPVYVLTGIGESNSSELKNSNITIEGKTVEFDIVIDAVKR